MTPPCTPEIPKALRISRTPLGDLHMNEEHP